jgi:enoyl-CoA hydratase
MNPEVSYEKTGRIAHIRMDDGKVNVMSPALLDALHDAFDTAERDAVVVILTGRDRIFSAGFDLDVICGGDAELRWRMLRRGAELASRILSFPTPVVCACNGHALPMGAFLMLASDVRIGSDGAFGIGLNEVAIGLTVPQFGIELARQRLTPAYYNRSLTTGQRFLPQEAVQAGFLDMVVAADQLAAQAQGIAAALSGIDFAAHAATKAKARKHAIEAVSAAIDAELSVEMFRASLANAPPGT